MSGGDTFRLRWQRAGLVVSGNFQGDRATGRFTHPQEVADIVTLLVSGRAGNVAGSDVVIDGGLVTAL